MSTPTEPAALPRTSKRVRLMMLISTISSADFEQGDVV